MRGGDEAREKRLRINIGTDKRPKFVEFGARSTSRPSGKKSETFEPTEVATERQVALSLRRIEKRKYIIKEFVQRSAAFAEDYHGPIAAIHEEILGRTGLELNNLITPDESS